jgi:hypothetical protein
MKTDIAQETAFHWVLDQVGMANGEVIAKMLKIDPTLCYEVSRETAWGSVAALFFNTAVKLMGDDLLEHEYVNQTIQESLPVKKSEPEEFDVSDFTEHSSWYDDVTFNGKTGEIHDEIDIGELPMKFSVQLFNAVYDYEDIDDALNHCFKTRYCRDEIENLFLEFLIQLQKQYETPENKAKIDKYITVLGWEN